MSVIGLGEVFEFKRCFFDRTRSGIYTLLTHFYMGAAWNKGYG
jgi:hypothetical protein